MTEQENLIYDRLVNKSIDAFTFAIEIINKPTLRHRSENFVFNMCNAWELILKAQLVKDKGEDAIYYKKNKDIRAFMDQDCFNAVFNGNVIYLPCTYNYMPVNQSSYTNEEIADFYGLKENIIPDLNKYAYIIHMTNKQKPWNYCNVFGADLWARYYYMSILRNCKIKYFNDKFVGTATLKNYKKFWELFFKKEKGY